MAGKLKNLGTALKDSKTRILLVLTLIIMAVGLTIGWLGFKKKTQSAGVAAAAGVTAPPSIRSTPGIGAPSAEYVKAVKESDTLEAQQASRTGGSNIATLTRTSYIASDQADLASIPSATTGKENCSVAELQRARQAGVRAEELRLSGCDAAALRQAGYTAGELLNAGFSAKELRAAGFSARELKDAGFSAAELREAGFTAGELAAAGFNAGELSPIGFTADELAAAGMNPKNVSKNKDCNISALRQSRNQGVPAAQLRDRGCNANALRLAGYTAQELRDAGFSAGELRRAGFTVNDLRNAAFNANDLRNAGASAGDLSNAGFKANDLQAAGYSRGELARAGINATQADSSSASNSASSVPTQVNQNDGALVAHATLNNSGADTLLAAPPVDPSIQALQQLQQRQAEQLSEQERLEAIQRMQEAMNSQVGELVQSWTPPTNQQYVEGKANAQAQGNGSGAAGSKDSSGTTGQALPIIKAGTILFATLDTALNSDEPGPILATIIQGGFKGAKLVGQFQREDKKVLLSFNILTMPSFPTSIPVDAVAIDVNTARTALADHVDNHYLSRYGVLLGSSFLSGLGQATMESGSEVESSLFGFRVKKGDLSAAEKAQVALGQVGVTLGNAMAPYFNRPPTVKVNAGIGIGLLFRNDVTLTSDQQGSQAAAQPAVAPGAANNATTQQAAGSQPNAGSTQTAQTAPSNPIPLITAPQQQSPVTVQVQVPPSPYMNTTQSSVTPTMPSYSNPRTSP